MAEKGLQNDAENHAGRAAADARAANLAAPAIVVIGDVVRTRQQLLDAAAQVKSSQCES